MPNKIIYAWTTFHIGLKTSTFKIFFLLVMIRSNWKKVKLQLTNIGIVAVVSEDNDILVQLIALTIK